MIHKVQNLTIGNLKSLGSNKYKVALSEKEILLMEPGHMVESVRWPGKQFLILQVNKRTWWTDMKESVGIKLYWSIGLIITDKWNNG